MTRTPRFVCYDCGWTQDKSLDEWDGTSKELPDYSREYLQLHKKPKACIRYLKDRLAKFDEFMRNFNYGSISRYLGKDVLLEKRVKDLEDK